MIVAHHRALPHRVDGAVPDDAVSGLAVPAGPAALLVEAFDALADRVVDHEPRRELVHPEPERHRGHDHVDLVLLPAGLDPDAVLRFESRVVCLHMCADAANAHGGETRHGGWPGWVIG